MLLSDCLAPIRSDSTSLARTAGCVYPNDRRRRTCEADTLWVLLYTPGTILGPVLSYDNDCHWLSPKIAGWEKGGPVMCRPSSWFWAPTFWSWQEPGGCYHAFVTNQATPTALDSMSSLYWAIGQGHWPRPLHFVIICTKWLHYRIL